MLKISPVFKLKLLKLYIKLLVNNSLINKNYINFISNFIIIYYFKLYQLNKINLLNINFDSNTQLKKLNFFKNNYVNSTLFYNSIKQMPLVTLNYSNYNNYLLFFYYNFFIKNIVFSKNKYYSNFYQNNLYFIRFFIFKYLNGFLKNKNLFLSLQKNNINILENNLMYKILLKKTKRLGFLKEISFKIKSFINLILICLYNKDVILFKNVIKGILEKLHFKKHKKFLYNLRVLLKTITYVFFFKFKCLGLYIKIKGKIGVGGNSKKRKYLFKLGSFSFTKKSQKLVYAKDCIRTYSGVLGFETYLTYK